MIMSSNVPEIQHVMDVTVVNAFLPFLSPHSDSPKMKSSKKWKKCLKISSFYTSVPKIMTICCAAPEIWCVIDVIIFHFRLFFAVYPHNSPKNEHFKKIKKCLKISSLYTIVPKIMTMLCCSWDMVCDRCNYFSF